MARRERRPIWVALAIASAAVVAGGTWLGARSQATAFEQGEDAAARAARTVVAPIVAESRLGGPADGPRARALHDEIARALSADATFVDVRIFGQDGRLLLGDAGPRDETSSPVTDAVDGHIASTVRDGAYTAYVPVRPGEGTLRIVELTAASGRFVGSNPLQGVVPFAVLGCVFALAMIAVTGHAPATTKVRAALYQPAIPRRPRPEPVAAATNEVLPTVSVFAVDERIDLENRLRESHARAKEAEESFISVQGQLKTALAHLNDLEGRLTMEQTQSGSTQQELDVLRQQVRETSERLHQAEIENDALRERMAARHNELADLRHAIATSSPSDEEMSELRLRLETAENAAAALARELDRVETELELTRSRFHMAMLTEALREFDNDALEIEHEEMLDHTVVIRNGSSATTPAQPRR